MPPTLAERIQKAVSRVNDQAGLLELLRDALEWPIPEDATAFEDLGYDWTEPESQVEVRQLLPGQPWGIFLVVGSKPTFRTELRKILRRLVSNRRDAALPQWKHENLLFLCITKDHKSITFAHFKGETAASARLALFGWLQHDLHIHTLCKHNLPALVWPADTTRWSAAFDVEAVTKSFFKEYKEVFDLVEGKVKGVPKGEACRLYTQRLFNRLLFLYFIQRKNWLDFHGDKRYLRALFTAAVAAKEDFLNERLYWAFFYGLNNGMEDRESHSVEELIERRGTVPFLNGGLFDLESDYNVQHAVTIDNAAFGKVLDLFEKYNFTVAESTPDRKSVV